MTNNKESVESLVKSVLKHLLDACYVDELLGSDTHGRFILDTVFFDLSLIPDEYHQLRLFSEGKL